MPPSPQATLLKTVMPGELKDKVMKSKQTSKFAAACLWFAAFLLSSVAVRAGGAPLDGYAYIKGANLPWIDGDFYNDIAVNPHYPSYGCGYNSAHMNSYLADLHSMGVTVVRFWVNTDDQGCTLDGNGYVNGVTSLFWTNLDNVVALAGSNNITLYLTLSEGRFDWLTNSAMANAYKNNCLIPLVQRYKGNSRIFGIDLMNEIDSWVVDPNMGNPWIPSGASWAQAQAYITNLAAAVHSIDSNRLVSCSHVYHGWSNLSSWKGLGLDFYDFHYYADTISFPTAASLNMDKPIYVGECGQANADLTWSDALQSACELEALNSGYNAGYAGVSIWSYSLPDWQTTDYMQYAMLNTDGTHRAVCNAMQAWSAATAPGIVSFSPASSAAGTAVVVTGTNFTGATVVSFNGTAANFTVNSATQITATVPANATTGPIIVTTADGPVVSAASFTVVANLVIYDDILGLENSFQDNESWATINDANTSPAYSGNYSISVSAAQWDALWLSNAGLNTSNYFALNFWINGGASGASGVQVMGVVGGSYVGYTNLPTLPANTWQQFTIPLAMLGVANIANCNGFWFRASAGVPTSFSLDAIQLVVPVPAQLSPVSAKPFAGKFVIQITGQSGQTYRIETSTNLVNWNFVSTNLLTTTTANLTNSVISGSSRQFWRAISP